MKDKIINYQNVIELAKLVDTNEQLLKSQEYLKKYNLVITLRECFDSQSGWTGQYVFLEGVDLSGNGYCYGTRNLMKHIDTHQEYLKVKETDEYKLYLKLKDKFKVII